MIPFFLIIEMKSTGFLMPFAFAFYLGAKAYEADLAHSDIYHE